MNNNEFRVKLELITPEDTYLIVKWRNNEKVRKNFIFQEDFTEEMHLNWLNTKVANKEVVQFIIKIKENDKPIGSVYFRDIDYDKKEAEYGIFIGEDDERGKGYGSETVKLALDYAFNVINLESIILRVFADNKSAIKSYESAGFKFDRIERNFIESESGTRDLVFMKIKKLK